MRLYLITPPDADAVVTLAEAKAHLRVDVSDDDDLITGYIAAAVANLDGRDGWLGRALGVQTWELRLASFPPFTRPIWVPLPPLIEVESVTYYDADDVLQTLPAEDYEVGGAGSRSKGWIAPASGARWPATGTKAESVMVRFRAGYEPAGSPPVSTMPAPVKVAVLRMVGGMYEVREDLVVNASAVRVPSAVKALLAPLRVW